MTFGILYYIAFTFYKFKGEMKNIQTLYPHAEDKEANVNTNTQEYDDQCHLGRSSLDSFPLTNLTDHGSWVLHRMIL